MVLALLAGLAMFVSDICTSASTLFLTSKRRWLAGFADGLGDLGGFSLGVGGATFALHGLCAETALIALFIFVASVLGTRLGATLSDHIGRPSCPSSSTP